MTKSLTLPDAERDHVSGSANGSIKLLEYGDYECPFCGEAHAIVKEIQRRLGNDLLFAFRNFPLTNIHPHAEHAAEAAEAASAQGNFWGMHDLMFENQRALDDEDLAVNAAELGLDEKRLVREVISSVYAPRIREDFKSGVRGGVNGTPTFFINGERYDGTRDLKHLLNALTPQSRGKRMIRSWSFSKKNKFRGSKTSLPLAEPIAHSLHRGGSDVRSKRE
jgi:protein-disulfide isomerase